MTRRRRILTVALAVLTAVAAFIAAPVVWLTWDESPPDDSDLAIHRLDIPEADNGLTYLVAAQAKVSLPAAKDEEQCRAMAWGRQWDDALAKVILERDAEALALQDRAAACPHLEFPQTDILGTTGWNQTRWILLARLGCIRAEASARQGRRDQALNEAMKVVRLGRAVQCGKGVQVVCLTGNLIEQLGLTNIRRQLTKSGPAPDHLAAAARQLASLPDPGEGLAQTYRAEYAALYRLAMDVCEDRMDCANISGPRLQGYARLKDRLNVFLFLRPNETKRVMAEAARRAIEDAVRPKAEAHAPQQAAKGLRRNALGLFMAQMLDGQMQFTALKYRIKTEAAATEVLLALKAFKAKTGRLPATLDELVPEFLPAVPLDDFDGKPIRYSHEKKVVYSVGEDFKDDGGMTREESRAWWNENRRTDEAPLGDDEDPDIWNLPDPSFPVDF